MKPGYSEGDDEHYREWWKCPKCECKSIAKFFKYCPVCGKRYTSGVKYCAIDGADLKDIENK